MDRANELINQYKQSFTAYKLPFALSIVGIVLIIGGIFSSNLLSSKPKKAFPKESLVESNNIADFKIDISGAVKSPGVYSVTSSSRVEDAIKVAGGFLDTVNKEYVAKSLNLSAKLADGQKIYIPFEGEKGGGVVYGVSANTGSIASLVGLNSATEGELNSLPGVGPVTSQKIISGRPYSDVNELITKKIVSKSVFAKIKDSVDLH